MSARPITQLAWFPTHCAMCIQQGKRTPATWMVNQGKKTGRVGSLLACDEHRAILELAGLAALKNTSSKAV